MSAVLYCRYRQLRESPCLSLWFESHGGHQASVIFVFYGIFNAFFYGCLPIFVHGKNCWRGFEHHFIVVLS